jgi:hypothetical protein
VSPYHRRIFCVGVQAVAQSTCVLRMPKSPAPRVQPRVALEREHSGHLLPDFRPPARVPESFPLRPCAQVSTAHTAFLPIAHST